MTLLCCLRIYDLSDFHSFCSRFLQENVLEEIMVTSILGSVDSHNPTATSLAIGVETGRLGRWRSWAGLVVANLLKLGA
jgi:hypothetical protein